MALIDGGFKGGKLKLKLGLLNSGTLVKAQLIPWEAGVPKIEFMFNPTELTFEHVLVKEESPGAKTETKGNPKINYSYKLADKVTINKIVFDCYEDGDNVLEKYIEPFRASIELVGSHKASSPLDLAGLPAPLKDAIPLNKIPNPISELKGAILGKVKEKESPPTYRFIWGDQIYLRHCQVEKLTYKLTMFLPDGTPVRAVIDSLSLKEVDEKKPSNDLAATIVDRIADGMTARLSAKASLKL